MNVTAEELFAHPEHRYRELVRGALRVREPPGGVHGLVAARLAGLLIEHVERHALGTVLVESGYVLRRNPDTVRGPDLSFIGAARLAPGAIPVAFIPGAPDLAVEILSPDDRPGEIEERLADYFAAGTRLVWVVEPRTGTVVVRHPGRAPRTLDRSATLDGEDVVPGFACPVRRLVDVQPGTGNPER
jgi:Uma2 family endonuclease